MPNYCTHCGKEIPGVVNITEENLPDKYKPVGMWKYFWAGILFSLPVIGFIFTIIFAFGGAGGRNVNMRNFARSKFCVLIICIVVFAIIAAVAAGTGLFDYIAKSQGLMSAY